MKVGQGLRRQKTVENLRALQYAPHFLSFLLVGAGCGFLLVNALYNAMANEPELEKDGKTFGQFSIIQGAVGLASGLLYLFWNLRCPHCLTMRQEQVGVSILILSNVIAFLILSAFWSVGAPDYPVFVAGAAAAQVIGNFTIYLLFPMVSTYYAGWLVAPVRAGTDVSSLITSLIGQAQNPDPGSGHLNFSIGTLFFIYAIFSVCGLGAWASIMYLGTGLRYEIDDEGTVTLSESEDESDESRTWESDESECREFHVVRPHYGCLDGLACPRQLLLPVVLATLSQVAQWGIAASLGQIGAAMTDPVGCHGHQGKRVYRYALTSSMISVPIGSILSTAWNCPRSIFNALSCVQLLAAAVVGSVAMGFFEPLSSFMKTPEGQNMYIICFTLVGGLEGYLLTMAYRYVGDAIDEPGLRRQSASRLLSLLGVLAVNPFSFTIGVQISNGSIHCVDM